MQRVQIPEFSPGVEIPQWLLSGKFEKQAETDITCEKKETIIFSCSVAESII